MVKTGEVVKVKVMDVDVKRNRIALSMRLTEEVERKASKPKEYNTKKSQPSKSVGGNNRQTNKAPVTNNAMAQAFANLKK